MGLILMMCVQGLILMMCVHGLILMMCVQGRVEAYGTIREMQARGIDTCKLLGRTGDEDHLQSISELEEEGVNESIPPPPPGREGRGGAQILVKVRAIVVSSQTLKLHLNQKSLMHHQ